MNQTETMEKATTVSPKTFFFSAKETHGNAQMKALLGGKGANLAEMCSLGIPVPPGFTIATSVCADFYRHGEKLSDDLKTEVLAMMARIEKTIGKGFGDPKNPLLVSVRSGARVSMPGMMDTILNLGLNDVTVEGLATQTGNPRFAWDCYRRFIQMYSDVVLGMNGSLLEVILEDMKDAKGVKNDTDLTADDLKLLVQKFKSQLRETTRLTFPTDPVEQLWGAIGAVFRSWNTPRAVTYRELHGYPNDWGTAVNIQSMVFGNLGEDSATGVAFTRNPSTGEKEFYGEFLINAQGEDVVAGIRTPLDLTRKAAAAKGTKSLEELMPEAYQKLVDYYQKLEAHYRDMQDIEFTIERNQLWILQTRGGKRTTQAALRIACDLIDEKVITEHEALLRVQAKSLDQLLHPTLDPDAKRIFLAKGLPASPGGATGAIVFHSEDAVAWKERGQATILVRIETSPEDIEGMISSQGILTTRGGMTSHAAVVARGMGKCCVAGCSDIEIDVAKKTMRVKGYVLKEGDAITLDGSSGEVFLGEVKTREPVLDRYFERFMNMADGVRTLKIRANADHAGDAEVALRFGAEGIGLCRTEHMFFAADRIDVMREMIMADNREERVDALKRLLPMQNSDFLALFQAMDGHPVTIRLLDPPLHEFLPHNEKDTVELAERLGWNVERLRNKVRQLHEFNPMLGHRGCRLAITYPEIYQMQARAIALAACEMVRLQKALVPEIMIPLVGVEVELQRLKDLVDREVKSVQNEKGVVFDYLVGTMIELPRAAMIADRLAEFAQFFSFGTNDLTQTTLGLSRDDAGRFLSTYINDGILPQDPFQTIDQEGVGELVKKAVELGRNRRPDIKLGVCGEHGGDPASIEFFHRIGLDYVSCSPYRVPIARLSAAQAALQQRKVEH